MTAVVDADGKLTGILPMATCAGHWDRGCEIRSPASLQTSCRTTRGGFTPDKLAAEAVYVMQTHQVFAAYHR